MHGTTKLDGIDHRGEFAFELRTERLGGDDQPLQLQLGDIEGFGDDWTLSEDRMQLVVTAAAAFGDDAELKLDAVLNRVCERVCERERNLDIGVGLWCCYTPANGIEVA